jgi:ribosomal 30S subunit maturation factor RimM
VLIPFTDEFVPDVNLAAGQITIDLPEGYLDET